MMQTISYSFYKRVKNTGNVAFSPEKIQFNKNLSGDGFILKSPSDQVILYFGGSNDIAYNAVAEYGGTFPCPFIAADYYGSQKSKGKRKPASMEKTADDRYDWVKLQYPN